MSVQIFFQLLQIILKFSVLINYILTSFEFLSDTGFVTELHFSTTSLITESVLDDDQIYIQSVTFHNVACYTVLSWQNDKESNKAE